MLLPAILLTFATPTSAQSEPPTAPSMDEVMDGLSEMFVPEIQKLLEPGEKVDGWNQLADVVQLLAEMEGGTAENMLVEIDAEGKVSTRYFGRAFDAAMLPDDWKLVKQKGDIDLSGPKTMMEIFEFDGPFVVVLHNRYSPNGNAICTTGTDGYRVYRRPDIAESMPEMMILGLIRSVELAFENRTVCETHQAYDSYFVPRNFDGQGHSLPKLDEDVGKVMAMRYRPFAELTQD